MVARMLCTCPERLPDPFTLWFPGLQSKYLQGVCCCSLLLSFFPSFSFLIVVEILSNLQGVCPNPMLINNKEARVFEGGVLKVKEDWASWRSWGSIVCTLPTWAGWVDLNRFNNGTNMQHFQSFIMETCNHPIKVEIKSKNKKEAPERQAKNKFTMLWKG